MGEGQGTLLSQPSNSTERSFAEPLPRPSPGVVAVAPTIAEASPRRSLERPPEAAYASPRIRLRPKAGFGGQECGER